MGKYSGAKDVEVTESLPFLTDVAGNHTVRVVAVREGDSNNDGLPYVAIDVEVLDSEEYSEGEKRVHLVKQHAGKGARNYWLRDLKEIVGASQGFEDKSDVDDRDIEAFTGEDARGTGAVLLARVYTKPPTKLGKTFNGVTFKFLAADLED